MVLSLVLMTALSASGLPPKADALMSPVVRVRLPGGDGGGSGTVMHWDGERSYILTNAHVTGGSSYVLVEVFHYASGGREVTGTDYEADVLVEDVDQDIAILVVEAKLRTARMLPLEEWTELLEPVWLSGCPMLMDPIVSEGEITDLDEAMGGWTFIVASAHIWHGNSGGAAFVERDGGFYWVGIPSRMMTDGYHKLANFAYIIPRDRVAEVLWAHDLGFVIGY